MLCSCSSRTPRYNFSTEIIKLSDLIWSDLIVSYRIVSYLIWSDLFCSFLLFFFFSYVILFYLISPYVILLYIILSYLIVDRVDTFCVFFVLFFFYTLFPCDKFGSPYMRKATASARAALYSSTNACWVFSCFRNQPTLTWTTGALTCVRDHSYAYSYTHKGVGHTDSETAQHFWLEKNPLHF